MECGLQKGSYTPSMEQKEPILIQIRETDSISSDDTGLDTSFLQHQASALVASPFLRLRCLLAAHSFAQPVRSLPTHPRWHPLFLSKQGSSSGSLGGSLDFTVSYQSLEHQFLQHPLELDVYQPPKVKVWKKAAEGVRLAYTRGKVNIEPHNHKQQPISEAGRFNHYYVYPLDNRNKKNERIILGRWKSRLEVRDGNGTQQRVIQAASHNYAGFYTLTKDAEELQRLSLERLPVAASTTVPSLEAAMHNGLAKFFSTDFCYTTSTGYGSNLLAFSAILNEDWLVMFDDKCHNSMHVAAFLSHAGTVKKFPHANFQKMEEILLEYKGKVANVLVAIEGFYSMDGTVPALDVLARLKKQYSFTLLADEAHSLMCLGRTGRGAIEVWNEQNPTDPVSTNLFDIRTGTLSKSVGAVGGIVCGKARFAPAVLKRRDEMLANGADHLPTSSIIQTLHVLGQPTLLQRHLERLAVATIFVREELHRAGVHVYGNAISPILPVYAGRPSMAAKMSYALRKVGLLATPVSTPAVPFWESRVRVCLSADHDNDTINGIVAAIVKAAQNVGLISKKAFHPNLFAYPDESPRQQEAVEAHTTADDIRKLIKEDTTVAGNATSDAHILRAGHEARHRYGLGSGGARWITGTSELHIQVETLAAKLTGTLEAMTYPDSYIGLMSTVAALSRPVTGFKKHVFLVPDTPPQAVLDGFRVASRKGFPRIQQYTGVGSLIEHVRSYSSAVYITCFLDSTIQDDKMNMQAVREQVRQARGVAGMTFLLHDATGAGSLQRDQSSFNDQACESRDHHVLVFGSFYRAFRLPGAYLAGSPVLLKELRYTSRGYMFTTSQLPFVMGMAAAELGKMIGERE